MPRTSMPRIAIRPAFAPVTGRLGAVGASDATLAIVVVVVVVGIVGTSEAT